MAINRATLALERELHALTGRILDAQTRAIVDAWVTAWDQVAADVDAAALELVNAASGGRVTRTMVIRSRRAQAAIEAVAEALEDVASQASGIITADLNEAVAAAAQAEADMVASQLTGERRATLAANLVRADAGQVYAMVERATKQITARTRPISAEATAAIRRELLRGIAVGANPRTAARRMVRGIEDRFEGGATRALLISRTEMLDATRQAAMWTDKANADVVTGWEWVAHLDPATCRSCISRHGTVHSIDTPGPEDHPAGRCARVPRTKTWAELGFTGIPDPPSLVPDADAWFNSLPEADQRGILGQRGYQAWKAGTYPRSAWSTRKENPDWRPSYQPSRAPAA